MAKSKTTLTQKLFGYYFGLSLITIFILSFYSYYSSKQALISRTYDQLNSVKFEKERNIENFFIERMDEANQISRYENWRAILAKAPDNSAHKLNKDDFLDFIETEYQEKIAKHFNEKFHFKTLIIKTDDLNWKINLDTQDIKSNFELPEAFDADILSDFNRINDTNRITIVEDLLHKKLYLGSRIFNNVTDKSEGLLLLEIDMASINSIMFNTNVLNGLGKTGEAYVVGTDQIMRTSSRFKSNSINKIRVNTPAVEKAFQNITATGEYDDYRNITVLGSYGKINIPGLHWAILVEIDLEEAMIPIYTLRNSIIILSLIISIIIFGIVLIISQRILLPVEKLKMAAESISKGNFDSNLVNNSTDEIGDLTRAFNKMSAKIKLQTEEIQLERAKRITSVIDGQEQERQRLSRELHDSLGQQILAIKMKLERAEKANAEMKQHIIDDAKKLLMDVSGEIVSMSENLMPPVLSQFGLISGIENLCEEIRKNKEINIEFSYNELPEKCEDNVKIYLYRIIQEALNNIVKHAEASKVEVSVLFENDIIRLRIADNGKGFVVTKNRKSGNGINNMNDRAEILGGNFKLVSNPGMGTTIEVLLRINVA